MATEDAGVDDFLGKPIREAELLAKIARHLGIRYRYAEDVLPPPTQADAGVPHDLTPAALAALPPPLIAGMQQVIEAGETDLLAALIREVAEVDAVLAEALRALADDYDYDTLATVLTEKEC